MSHSNNSTWPRPLAILCLLLAYAASCCLAAQGDGAPIGLFEAHGDVGVVLHPGSVEFDQSKQSYTITGSGENVWAMADAFQFVWKKMSGDVMLAADISFPTKSGDPHKKAVLMIRQSLDADAAYADVAVHGNGLTSLQSREQKGVATHEIQANISGPRRVRVEKRGQDVYISMAQNDEAVHFAGGSMRVALNGSFYVGIGVCAHNKDVEETAVFSNVEIAEAPKPSGQPVFYSTIETITVASTDRRVVTVLRERVANPTWSRDGASLFFARDGGIASMAVTGGVPAVVDIGSAHSNTFHGVSPDGTLLAVGDESKDRHRSGLYVVTLTSGAPRRVTSQSPAYFHGWSPDGTTLAFATEHKGKFDIFAVPAVGGKETRLTNGKGRNDNPEFSPDGKYIYFSSDRTGTTQIWRMLRDGTSPEQITSDNWNNSFPHPSPDGRRMAFLSYEGDARGYPRDQDVTLRVMSISDNKTSVLAKFTGGQGTMGVPAWSPDSRRLAFVSYQLRP